MSTAYRRFRQTDPTPAPAAIDPMEALDNFAWTVDPSRPVARELTDAEVDALCAEWRARNPGR